MGDFGDPVYSGEVGGTVQAPTDAASFIDPNDPRLSSEVLDDDTTKNAYAVPPPPPDGKWLAKATLAEIKDKRTGKPAEAKYVPGSFPSGDVFLAANIDFALSDLSGRYDGVKLTEYWVKTAVDKRKGVSQISTMCHALGAEVPANWRASHLDKMGALHKVLAREPQTVVETTWEASCQTCEENANKRGERRPGRIRVGMRNFPQPKPGVFDPLVQCPTCGSAVRAQARLTGFFKVGEVKVTQGLAQGQPAVASTAA